jgi:hypothetical protein
MIYYQGYVSQNDNEIPYTPTIITKTKNNGKNQYWKDTQQCNLPFIADGNVK